MFNFNNVQIIRKINIKFVYKYNPVSLGINN
ncbi:Uncharacterised protein [uncultured Clostridium sp.]|nr:Uncharacterised protein [uncultured Clostridium sp.]